MKHTHKKLLTLACATTLTLSLTACGGSVGEDLNTVLTGTIDSQYKGSIRTTYLELTGLTSDRASSNYADTQRAEIEYMMALYGYGDLPEAKYINDFMPLYTEMFKSFEYTTGEPVKNEDGSYTITITFAPLALGEALDAVAMPYYQTAPHRDDLLPFDRMAQDAILMPMLVDAMTDFNADIQYSEEVTVDVDFRQDSNDFWHMDEDDLAEFSSYIIDYNMG